MRDRTAPRTAPATAGSPRPPASAMKGATFSFLYSQPTKKPTCIEGVSTHESGAHNRVRTLAERYETHMPDLAARVATFETKAEQHLKRLGFAW